MKTDNTDPTETVESVEAEEISADVETVESTVDVEEVQDAEVTEDGEEVDAYDPNDPLFGDNAPTPSAHKPVSNSKKLGTLGLIMLTLFGIFGIGFIGNGASNYIDARWETDCIQGQRVEARIPSNFDGNIRAYMAAGNKVTEMGTCDNIAWQR
jgi:hypothetical protein